MRLPDGPLTTYRADDGSIGIATIDGTALDGAQPPRPATKAASLRVGSQQRAGFWLGDPVAGGVFVESGGSTAGSAWGAGWRDGGAFNYRAAVGDGLGNSIVDGCLRAIAEAVGEPPPRLYALDAEDERQPTKEPRDLLRLLRRPNPSMTWERLAVYVAIAQHVAGAAYLWKARSQNRRVTQLWPLPPDKRTIWPLEGPDTAHWIAGFAYKPAGHEAPIPLPADDVVYLPYGGLNLGNLRQPRSPLDSVTKQLFTDEEAADFTASVLRNFGVPGVILSPDPAAMGSGGTPTEADLERQKAIFKQKFGGASRGEPMALRAPYRVSVVSYSPEQMRLDRLQMLPEARICSALGVPPIVALLLSGLEQATYSNARQMREQFIEQKMVPYWRLLESDLTWALLPEFGGDPERAGISLDLQDVRALQEDQDAKYKRMTDLAARGLATINQVQQELGFKGFGPDGDVLLLPQGATPVRPDDLLDVAKSPAVSPTSPEDQQPAQVPASGNSAHELLFAHRSGTNGRAQ